MEEEQTQPQPDILSSSDNDNVKEEEDNENLYGKWWLHDFGCDDTIAFYRNNINQYVEKRRDFCYNEFESIAYQHIVRAERMLLNIQEESVVEKIRQEYNMLAIEYYRLANEHVCSLWMHLSEIECKEMCDGNIIDEPLTLLQYVAHLSGALYVMILGLLIQCDQYRKAAEMIFTLATQAPNEECRRLYEYGVQLLNSELDKLDQNVLEVNDNNNSNNRKRSRNNTSQLNNNMYDNLSYFS